MQLQTQSVMQSSESATGLVEELADGDADPSGLTHSTDGHKSAFPLNHDSRGLPGFSIPVLEAENCPVVHDLQQTV